MPAFRIVYTSDPGFAELLSVAQTAIIDRAPPRLILGNATGVACIVGEFERGPLEVPTEVFGPGDRFAVPGVDSMSIVPPASDARSCIPNAPNLARSGVSGTDPTSNPMPSSWIVSTNVSSAASSLTFKC